MADAPWNQAHPSRTTLPQEADVWRQFASIVRQEIESLRGELDQWQRDHVEPIRQALQARDTLSTRVELERSPTLALRESSVSSAYPTSLVNSAANRAPQRDEENATDDDRLRFLKERLARQLGTEGGGT